MGSDQVGLIGLVSTHNGVKYKLVGPEAEIDPFIFVNCPSTPDCVELRLKNETINGDEFTLDREKKEKYEFGIQAFDSDGNIVEEDSAVIHVRDENDNQPSFTTTSSSISCDENLPRGEPCGFVQAIDPDYGINGKVEYKMKNIDSIWYRTGGTEISRHNLGLFSIDPYSGAISLVSDGNDFDREKYEKIKITAQDAPGKSSRTQPVEQDVMININDINDNNVIVVEYEKEIKVSESEEIGNQLTSIVAKDEDATEQNRFIAFELLDSNSPFALNQHGDNTVSLILKDKLDFEEKALYYVNIKALNKQANERIEQTEAIIQVKINVIDENEAP